MIELIVITAVTIAGYIKSRDFVQHRLRYVDSVQERRAPWLAGGAAALAAAPVAWLLPFVGVGAAIVFGIGVGAGTKAGAARIRRRAIGGV